MTSLTLPIQSECMCNTRLKRALAANAVFSAVSGALLVVAAPMVAGLILTGPFSLFGVGETALLRVLGGGLLIFAAIVGWTERQARPSAPVVVAISLADFGWVLGSALLLALGASAFTASGSALVIAVAALVLAFGVLQLGGLRHRR